MTSLSFSVTNSETEIPPPSGWQGHLELRFARQQEMTQLIHSQGTAPLKLQRPFYPEGPGICHGVILHTAGGIVGGDRLSLKIQLQANAQVLLTHAAAGKVYRSNGLEAQQNIAIQLAAGAYLEWLPRETIIFNAAQYRQTLRVDLAPGASWLGWDITRLGRTARNERFLQGCWRSHTEVWQEGRPLWIDPQWLPGGEVMLNSPHGLAGYPVIATLVYIRGPQQSLPTGTGIESGTEMERRVIEKIRHLWSQRTTRSEAGATRLMSGLVCRYRGHSTQEARDWFTEIWNMLRLETGQPPACQPRVWQL